MAVICSVAVLLMAGSQPRVPVQKQTQACCDCQTVAKSKAPRYRVARRIPIANGGLIVDVSIEPKHFNQNDLLALACRLNGDFAGENKLLVRLFDNHRSAKRYVSRWEQEKPAGWQEDEKAQRAYYMRDLAAGKHWVAWYTDALNKKGETSVKLCLPENSHRP